MNLVLRRTKLSPLSTIGELYLDGRFLCYTLEDTVREMVGVPVKVWKMPGVTAIPQGIYGVTITRSPRFGRDLPLLQDVPGFSGVRIHTGNRPEDTEGCILVGQKVGTDQVIESRGAFAALFEIIEGALTAGEPVNIDIRNP